MDAIADYALECAAFNAANARQIDATFVKRGANGNGKERKDKLTQSQLAARDAKTIHDEMADNPAMRETYMALMNGRL
jgi:hypothetical protein